MEHNNSISGIEKKKEFLKDLFFPKENFLKEGSKVKINVEKIKKEKNYNKRNPNWKNFIENNIDKIFTVEYDFNKKDNPGLVCLKEDQNNPKWLFYIGDLIQIEE